MSTGSAYTDGWEHVAKFVRGLGMDHGGVVHVRIHTQAPVPCPVIQFSDPFTPPLFVSSLAEQLGVEIDYEVRIGADGIVHVKTLVNLEEGKKSVQHAFSREMLEQMRTDALESTLKDMLTELGVPGIDGSFITLSEVVPCLNYTVGGVMDMMVAAGKGAGKSTLAVQSTIAMIEKWKKEVQQSLGVPAKFFDGSEPSVTLDSLAPGTLKPKLMGASDEQWAEHVANNWGEGVTQKGKATLDRYGVALAS